uniref:CAAX amino terminal protease n=1 Tax=Solanum tuberosum TaxID=4113 RepID=M1D3B7_SOLTU
MAGNLCITLTQSLPFSPKLYSSKPLLQKSHRISIAPLTPFLKFQDSAASQASTRGFTTICFSSPRNGPDYKGGGPDWPILRRWDVPWNWQTVSLSSLACGLSFVLTGLIETASIPYVGLDVEALSLDEKAEILFADQAYGQSF